MSRTVTVRRGEKLPENMVNESLVVWDKPIHHELKPGDVIPLNAMEDSYTVEVHDDPPPQAYLIVLCAKGEGTHEIESTTEELWLSGKQNKTRTHKQISCALTLEDLRKLFNYTLGTRTTVIPPECVEAFKRLGDTIAAWSAVPQPKGDA